MLVKSILFASLVIIASGRPQAPVELHAPVPSVPAGGQSPAGPAPGGQDPSHDHTGDHQPPASIVKNEFVDSGNGAFRWEFETSDGSRAEQTGHTVSPNEGEVIQGSYSYKSPDGQTISVTYIADANGFQPKGDHLPTPPPNSNAAAGSNSTSAAAAPAAASSPQAAGSPAGPPQQS